MPALAHPAAGTRDRKYLWTTLSMDAHPAEVPELVGRHTGRGLELWAVWWSTPVAVMWAPWDSVALERLLDAYELWWADQDQKILPTIQAIEDRFGLSPAGRRKLYVQIEGVDVPSKSPTGQAASGTAARPDIPSAGGALDPRLRVLAGGKLTG